MYMPKCISISSDTSLRKPAAAIALAVSLTQAPVSRAWRDGVVDFRQHWSVISLRLIPEKNVVAFVRKQLELSVANCGRHCAEKVRFDGTCHLALGNIIEIVAFQVLDSSLACIAQDSVTWCETGRS